MNDVPRELLRETLIGRLAPAPGACIDSERLAAWSEGTLHARERDAIEGHASECGRCQALLAAMVRTAPPVAPSRWWRPSGLGWFAPLAAAAAAILLWINVPRSPVDPSPASAPAMTATPEPGLPSVAAAPPSASPSTTPSHISERRPIEARRQARAKTGGTPSLSDSARPAQPPDDLGAAAIPQAKALHPAVELPLVGKSAPVETPTAATPPSAAAASPAVAPVPALPRAEAVPPSKFADAAPPGKFDSAGGAGGGAGGRGGAARLRAAPAEIVSPDASVRWRMLPGGSVARSVDRGATWQQQSTGVAVTLTAGAAPSSAVCWLVGPGGTIVLSTDGRTWQRVAFPEAIDLVSVRASDAANATVTSDDGRAFSTADGGKSWRQP